MSNYNDLLTSNARAIENLITSGDFNLTSDRSHRNLKSTSKADEEVVLGYVGASSGDGLGF